MDKDLYRDILGLPPGKRPPHYYDLLGIKVFESDGKKIHKAGLATIKKLRVWQAHKDSDIAAWVHDAMDAVSRACTILELPDKKEEYDKSLSGQLGVDLNSEKGYRKLKLNKRLLKNCPCGAQVSQLAPMCGECGFIFSTGARLELSSSDDSLSGGSSGKGKWEILFKHLKPLVILSFVVVAVGFLTMRVFRECHRSIGSKKNESVEKVKGDDTSQNDDEAPLAAPDSGTSKDRAEKEESNLTATLGNAPDVAFNESMMELLFSERFNESLSFLRESKHKNAFPELEEVLVELNRINTSILEKLKHEKGEEILVNFPNGTKKARISHVEGSAVFVNPIVAGVVLSIEKKIPAESVSGEDKLKRIDKISDKSLNVLKIIEAVKIKDYKQAKKNLGEMGTFSCFFKDKVDELRYKYDSYVPLLIKSQGKNGVASRETLPEGQPKYCHGIPFILETAYVGPKNERDGKAYGETFYVRDIDVSNVRGAYMLMNCGWGIPKHHIATITFYFSENFKYRYKCVTGVNLRDWRIGSPYDLQVSDRSHFVAFPLEGGIGRMDGYYVQFPRKMTNFILKRIKVETFNGELEWGVLALHAITLKRTP